MQRELEPGRRSIRKYKYSSDVHRGITSHGISVNDKKARERASLAHLYDPAAFLIEDAERPDFVLRKSAADRPFGVEVTELYDSEIAARLERIPQYPIDLMGGGSFRHKEDLESLVVDDVVFTSPDGQRRTSGRAVGRTPPPFADYITKLEERIRDKNSRAIAYRADLRHVNLVIVDRANRFWSAKPEHLYGLLFTETLRTVVARAPFREIYFIVQIESKRLVYVPLRMYLLVSLVSQFESALALHSPSFPLPCRSGLLRCLHSYLHVVGIQSELLEAESGYELFMGNSGVQWGDVGNLVVHDYADATPEGRRVSGCEMGPWSEPSFDNTFKDYRLANTFVLTVAFDVPRSAA